MKGWKKSGFDKLLAKLRNTGTSMRNIVVVDRRLCLTSGAIGLKLVCWRKMDTEHQL